MFRVFYSWQSDLPEAVNQRLIRTSLNEAAASMNADHDLDLHVAIDEATRDVPGSPNIADSIFTKIREADVFVCDLTKAAEIGTRKYCNPNVALELGYAVRVLGWPRIKIVFNEAYGVVPDDLPFDARGQLVSRYRCQVDLAENGRPTAICQSAISNATGHLRTILDEALRLIARENPRRPHELEEQNPEQIRRSRDVAQLRRLFRWLHLRLLDEFMERLSFGCLTCIGTDFHEAFETAINTSGFHINDSQLSERVANFATAWGECFRHAHDMDLRPDGREAHFCMPGDVARSPEQMAAFRHTRAQAPLLRAALDSLLEYVRQNYLEIDVSECGHEAHEQYVRDRQQASRMGEIS